MPEAGFTLSDQVPVAAVATVDLEDGTVTDLWRALFDAHPFREVFIRAVRSLATDKTAAEFDEELEERGVPGWLRWQLLDVARGDRRAAWALVASTGEGPDRSARRLGTDVGTVEELLATAGLLAAVDEIPTVAVRLGVGFRERRRDQREDVLRLLARLARGLDVRLVASGITRGFLRSKHRGAAVVRECCSDHRDATPLEATVETALVDLDPDGRPVALLRALAEETGAALTYSELYETMPDADESTVRRCLGRLADLELIERFGPSTERQVELLPAGREFLDAIDAEHGRQVTLTDHEDRVQNRGQSSIQTSGTHKLEEGEGSADSTTAEDAPTGPLGGAYRSRFLATIEADAAVGTAHSGAVTFAKDRLAGLSDGPDHRLFVTYDAGRAEGVVAVRTSTAMQCVVSLANAFTSVEFLRNDDLLDRLDDRLDPADAERLRDRRCIGWLDEDAIADPDRLVKRLVARRQEVEAMTRDLKQKRVEGEDTTALRSAIMQDGLGLVGTVMHLLDVADVDAVAELRIPEKLPPERLEGLATAVTYLASIGSEYDGCTAYRQLYEDREDKRRSALSPEVDATDPTGRLLGGLVFRGPDVHRLRSRLERALESGPGELHEDAPEFNVDVPVREAGREAVEATAERVLSRKRLRPTSGAISVLNALVASPYDVTRALAALEREHLPRDVRPDEVRYALATLDAEALLPDAPRVIRPLLATLLRAERRLSDADLVARADVCLRSLSRHQDVLEALDLVDVTADAPEEGGGWRLTLAFGTEEERLDGRLPAPASGHASFVDTVSDVAAAVLAPEEYADPGGNVHKSLSWPSDPWGVAADPRLEGWVGLAAALVGADPPTEERTVTMGPTIEQSALPTGANAPPRSTAD